MSQKIQGAQRDFSSGEIDGTLKRADDLPARKSGLRGMSNWRILTGGGVQDRPGRRALFLSTASRIEEVTMTPINDFKLAFGANELRIYNSSGAEVLAIVGRPWTAATVGDIVYCQHRQTIIITYPGMRPLVVSYDGTPTGWSYDNYTELVIGGQKRTPFYRISPQGITLRPAAQSGAGVAVVASAAVFVGGHIGTRMRFVNRQMLITGVIDALNATVTIEEALPGSQNMIFAVDPTPTFAPGDVVRGSKTGSAGIVYAVNAGTKAISVQLTTTNQSVTNSTLPPSLYDQTTANLTYAFIADGTVAGSDTVAGGAGALIPTSVSAINSPGPVTFWDDEVMNDMRGYPQSCFADQFRVGFCDFPDVPNGIAWSAINSPTDMYPVGATIPNGSMFEVAPDKVRVYYVVPGPESSELVFCDKKAYYIPINENNPLKPGSVAFKILSSDGCAKVQPRPAQDTVLYVNAGGNSVVAVIAPGAAFRPFNTRNLCDFHGHLFGGIVALAVPTADNTLKERYAYVLNGDGSLVCGKYTAQDGQIGGVVGWGPWSGVGTVKWVAASHSDVLFTTSYFGRTVCEILDDTQYLDGAVVVNNLPAALAPAPGLGPLWWQRSQTVSLMDQSTRSMGTYDVDSSGFIVPQGIGGENLAAASLVAGQPWTSMLEPFCPDANPGADAGQRMKRRRVSNFAAYIIGSSGFMMCRLYSGKRAATPQGTVMNQRRFTAYNQGDDATLPPPMRETTEHIRPPGRAWDPRVAIIKDVPGPMQVLELGAEATL